MAQFICQLPIETQDAIIRVSDYALERIGMPSFERIGALSDIANSKIHDVVDFVDVYRIISDCENGCFPSCHIANYVTVWGF